MKKKFLILINSQFPIDTEFTALINPEESAKLATLNKNTFKLFVEYAGTLKEDFEENDNGYYYNNKIVEALKDVSDYCCLYDEQDVLFGLTTDICINVQFTMSFLKFINSAESITWILIGYISGQYSVKKMRVSAESIKFTELK